MNRSGWLVLFAVVVASCARCQSPKFSPTAWRDPARMTDGKRCPMADTLIDDGVLLGRNDAQLDALLGPAEETGYFADWDRVYWLCDERGVGVDSEWLTLRLDGGVVVEATIRTD